MTIDEKVEAYRMRLNGESLASIGEKFGVSKQAVFQAIPRINLKVKSAADSCIYPHISEWMIDNNIGYHRISTMISASCGTVVASWLTGKHDPPKRAIDALLKVFGMTYEYAFYLPPSDASEVEG